MAAAPWLPVPPGTPFPLTSLPWGVFSRTSGPDAGVRCPCVALGDTVVDLRALAAAGLLAGGPLGEGECFQQV